MIGHLEPRLTNGQRWNSFTEMVTLRLSKLKRQRRRDPSTRQDAHAAQTADVAKASGLTTPLAPARTKNTVATSGESRTNAIEIETDAAVLHHRHSSRPLPPSSEPSASPPSIEIVGPRDRFDGNGSGTHSKKRAPDDSFPTRTEESVLGG